MEKTRFRTGFIVLAVHFLLLGCTGVSDARAAGFDKVNYYSKADGLKGAALKTALSSIIASHTTLSYNALWDAYLKTDVTDDGYIWDMYSNATKYVPNGPARGHQYSGEGDSYNREHSFPASWFDDASPMRTDLHHVIPTDGYVNNRRSNYSYGEVGAASYQSFGGFSRLGAPTSDLKAQGCNEKAVFEPNDIYKGDLARIYFYMVTCYESRLSSWSNAKMLDQSAYPAFKKWACQMLLKWAKEDALSEKETARLEAVYDIQHNRNPYVDFPGLEQYVWGTWADSTFSVAHYRNPYLEGPGSGEGGDSGEEGGSGEGGEGGNPDNPPTEAIPAGDYVLLRSAPDSWDGVYLITYTGSDHEYALDGSLESIDASGNISIVYPDGDVIKGDANTDARSFTIASTPEPGWYSIRQANGQYIGKTTKKNGIESSVSFDQALANALSIDGSGNAVIESTCGYVLRFNSSTGSGGTRFRYYGSGQKPIRLYRKKAGNEDSVKGIKASEDGKQEIHDLQGRRVDKVASHGIYIVGGRKVGY